MQNQVLDFWFEEAGSQKWFKKSSEFDQILVERFKLAGERDAEGDVQYSDPRSSSVDLFGGDFFTFLATTDD